MSANDSANDAKKDQDATRVLTADPETLKKDLEKARDSDPCFIMVRGPNQGTRIFLRGMEMTVGRDPAADISIADQTISRKHVSLKKHGDAVLVTDLKSANGTVINGKKIPPGTTHTLGKADLLKLGNVVLKFLPAGELEIYTHGLAETAANTDALTKVFNRKYLMEAAESEFKRAKTLGSNFSLAVFDLDFFKKVNDNMGHDAGDFVLKEFAALVKNKYLRQKDIFGRLGGEEFVLYFLNTSAEDAAKLADEIRAGVELQPFIYNNQRIPVTVSIGVAEINSTIETSNALFKEADKALYKAKDNGRNQVVVAN